MSQSTKLFPDQSIVRLLVGVDTSDGREIEAGAIGIVVAVSEEGRAYTVRFDEPAAAAAVVEAGNLILE